jgi:AcrR family transcriptional regulator
MLLAVGELGYDAASVETVLDRLAVPRSDFHRHFTGKQDCFARGCADAWKSLCGELLAAIPPDEPRRERLESALRCVLRLAGASPNAARALLTETPVAGSVALEARSTTLVRVIDALDGRCGEGRLPRAHPPLAGTLIIGAVEGVLVRPLFSGEPLDPDRMLPELIQFLEIYRRADPSSGASEE